MSYREVYQCDICHEEKEINLMMGVRFSDTRRFTLDSPKTTQGTHICTLCLDQLAQQLAPKKGAVTVTSNDGT